MKLWFATYFILFFLFGGGARGIYFRQQYRINPVTLLRGWTVYTAWFRLMALGAALVVAEMFAYTLFDWQPLVLFIPQYYVGALPMLFGLFLMFLGQRDMGKSWRVGLPEKKTVLKTEGIYRYSRNPIYVGLALTMCGVWLSLPTVIASVGLVFMLLSMQRVVQHEEAFLAKQHGKAFTAYKKQVARWISLHDTP